MLLYYCLLQQTRRGNLWSLRTVRCEYSDVAMMLLRDSTDFPAYVKYVSHQRPFEVTKMPVSMTESGHLFVINVSEDIYVRRYRKEKTRYCSFGHLTTVLFPINEKYHSRGIASPFKGPGRVPYCFNTHSSVVFLAIFLRTYSAVSLSCAVICTAPNSMRR
jgi:hypothetical protein